MVAADKGNYMRSVKLLESRVFPHQNQSIQQNLLVKMERKLHVPECMYRNAIISIIVSEIQWYSTTDIYSVENICPYIFHHLQFIFPDIYIFHMYQ